MREPLRKALENLKAVLSQSGENEFSELIGGALDGSDEGFDAFLKSNELWGGSGSIADQAGTGQARETRKPIELALIMLGERQLQAGIVNQRTAMWVDTYKRWNRDGI